MFRLKKQYLNVLGEKLEWQYLFLKEQIGEYYRHKMTPPKEFIIRFGMLRDLYKKELINKGIIKPIKQGRKIIYKYNT